MNTLLKQFSRNMNLNSSKNRKTKIINEPLMYRIFPLNQQTKLEIELQILASTHGFSPNIYDITYTHNEIIVSMEHIDATPLVDIYGENPQIIPDSVWDQIKNIVMTLYDKEDIEYPDINPYNIFQSLTGKLYILDFKNAFFTERKEPSNPNDTFLRLFVLCKNYTWNPDSEYRNIPFY
jgi:hypothetical protein